MLYEPWRLAPERLVNWEDPSSTDTQDGFAFIVRYLFQQEHISRHMKDKTEDGALYIQLTMKSKVSDKL